ncbi:MAG: type III pantothenate kinase, partial [Planctomycetota bacterium]
MVTNFLGFYQAILYHKIMILAIDIGNTNIHLGFYADDKFIANETIPNTSINKVFLDKVLKINGGRKIISLVKNILVSSTCPEVDRIINEWCKKVFKIKPLRAGKDFPIPIVNQTAQPEKVGKDRLLNALAARQIVKGKNPIVVISCGTAITFDVISHKGEFLGGVIAPGFHTMTESLHQNCALLPLIKPVKKEPQIIGKNTEDAINSGVYYGTIGLVKNIVRELVNELKVKPSNLRIILTGGDAKLVKPELPFKS